MSRRRAARRRRSLAPALIAGCILTAAAASLGLAGPAQAHTGSKRQGKQLPVSLAITSVSPGYASPGKTVRVTGAVTNNSSAVMTGISVKLRSSGTPLRYRDQLQEYVEGQLYADSYEPRAVSKPLTLAPGATIRWSAALPVREVGMAAFGVYPLAAEADNADGIPLPGATSRTFLPYWPGKHGQPRPLRQEIAWILPIVDQPAQGPCPGPVLLDNSLATSLAPGGRLSALLAAGRAESASTHLTWAIDPSLLASVQTMTRPYQVGGNGDCLGNASRAASHAAAGWLTGLRQSIAGQGVFVTPYADADIAALTRDNLDGDLTSAFNQGRAVAGRIIGRSFSPVPGAQASPADALNGIAWPADGLANRPLLEDLAVNKVTAVVLDSSMAQSSPGHFAADTAVASTLDEVNGHMRVLLADDTITQLLASANSPSQPPGTAFAVKQRFLAETAVIAAEAPNVARSIVVAPPRRWNPPAHLAESLLAETASAPWLKPVSLGQLAADGQPQGQIQLPTGPVKGELGWHLLRQIRALDRRVALLEGIRTQPDPTLSWAVAGVESSAWRGAAQRAQAQSMLNRISDYVTSQEQGVTITKPLPVTMGGLKGSPPVSIFNHLNYEVRVRLAVSVPAGSRITITSPGLVTVAPGTVVNVKLSVHAQDVGSRTIRLSLLSPSGKALPGTTVTMTIRATQFGTLALVILVAALGVFMITSAARAIRQGGTSQRPAAPSSSGPGGTGRSPASSGIAAGDSVETDDAARHTGPQSGQQAIDETAAAVRHDPTEDTDELARAPGQADRA
jgi:hypothetical protein